MKERDPNVRLVRGRRMLIDEDVAALYGVRTDALLRAVRRHSRRFPADFLLRLGPAEARGFLRRHGGSARRGTYAFTGEGVAMVSTVIRNKLAAQVHVAIIRAVLGPARKDRPWGWLQELCSPGARA